MIGTECSHLGHGACGRLPADHPPNGRRASPSTQGPPRRPRSGEDTPHVPSSLVLRASTAGRGGHRHRARRHRRRGPLGLLPRPVHHRRRPGRHLLPGRPRQDRRRAESRPAHDHQRPDQALLQPGVGRPQGDRRGSRRLLQRRPAVHRALPVQERQRRQLGPVEPGARLGQVARRLRYGDGPGHRRSPPAPHGRPGQLHSRQQGLRQRWRRTRLRARQLHRQ